MIRALARSARIAIDRELWLARFPHATFGEGVIIRAPERFSAGEGAFIDTRSYLSCGGGDWNGNRGYINVGRNSEIGPYSVFWGAGGIEIGDNVHIGAHVHVTAHEAKHFEPDVTDPFRKLDFEFGKVVIEDFSIICSGTSIIQGVRIGHHSMVGAGAVVINDIPPYSLAVGVPARVIKSWSPDASPEVLRELQAIAANGHADKWVP